MRLRELEKQVRRMLAGLEVPDPFDLRAFCASVAAARGRDLHLHQLPAGGRRRHRVRAVARDRQGRPRLLRGRHRVAAPAAHHPARDRAHPLRPRRAGAGAGGRDRAAAARPGPGDRRPGAAPLSYSAPQEQVAEMIATMLNERAGSAAARPPADPALVNLYDALAEPFLVERRGHLTS